MQQKMLKQMNVMDKEAEAEDEALADLASVQQGVQRGPPCMGMRVEFPLAPGKGSVSRS